MYRALVGDLEQPLAVVSAQCSFQMDTPFESVDLACAPLGALEAVVGMDLGVSIWKEH